MSKVKEYLVVLTVRLSLIIFTILTALLIVLALPWLLVYWVFTGRNLLNDVILFTQKLFKIEIG